MDLLAEAKLKAERDLLLYWCIRAHNSGHREGWEPGPSTQETMDGIHSLLANMGHDPVKPEPGGFPPMGQMWMECLEECTSEVERVRPDLYMIEQISEGAAFRCKRCYRTIPNGGTLTCDRGPCPMEPI